MMSTTSPGVRDFSPDQLLRIARLFADQTASAATPRPARGERQRDSIAHTPHLEVWRVIWPPSTSTGWHDHGSAGGVFVVVEGALEVQTWRAGVVHEDLLTPDEHGVFQPGQIHNATNGSGATVVSVHAYAPGLTEMTPYTWENGQPIAVDPR